MCKYYYVLTSRIVKPFFFPYPWSITNGKQKRRNSSLAILVGGHAAEHLFLYTERIITFTHVRHPPCAKIESARLAHTGPLPGTEIDRLQSLRMDQG